MPSRRFLQLDVFSPYPGAGNPLAVVLDGEGLDDATMQAIARWTGLPETTFVFPATTPDADYRLRMFSPQAEVPFAGHPSVGTAYAAIEAGIAAPRNGTAFGKHVRQEGIAGIFPLRIDDEDGKQSIAIRSPRAKIAEATTHADPRLADATRGWGFGALPPVLMDGGRRWWLLEVASEATLRAIRPDWDAIAKLAEATGSMGVFAYARSDAGQAAPGRNVDFAVRAFVGNGRRFEDAASGAANAVFAAWLDERGALPHAAAADGSRRFVVSQGREAGFDAQLSLLVDADGEVWSGGQVRTLIRGEIDWQPGGTRDENRVVPSP
ncbi:MAG: PhzF family phenazine biosynthesis protein [Pseudoxanthomonas sp.]